MSRTAGLPTSSFWTVPCHGEVMLANLRCCRSGSQLRQLAGQGELIRLLSLLSHHTLIKVFKSPLLISSGLEQHLPFPLKNNLNAYVMKWLLSLKRVRN